jgi:hypothetical protein
MVNAKIAKVSKGRDEDGEERAICDDGCTKEQTIRPIAS